MNNSPVSNVIEGFEQLTRDEIIDISVRHVLRNGRPSVISGCSFPKAICTYAGVGCAAAPFLTPQARVDYHDSWGRLVGDKTVPAHEYNTIWTLQLCHDASADSDDFIAAFKSKVRANFGDVPALDESVGGTDK
jgi:hypothetical protein